MLLKAKENMRPGKGICARNKRMEEMLKKQRNLDPSELGLGLVTAYHYSRCTAKQQINDKCYNDAAFSTGYFET